MKTYREALLLQSGSGCPEYFCVTEKVIEIVDRSGVKNGICVAYTHHTTCSVMIQERSFDESFSGQEYLNQDLNDIFETIIPTCRREGQYLHPGPKAVEFAVEHGESKKEALNTDAHLRSAFIGRSESIVIFDGILDLGKFGHIFFIDFDQTHPRERTLQIQIIGE